MNKEYDNCTVDGNEMYLNDMLVDLPFGGESFIFEIEDRKFKAVPENAIEFCMEYGRDSYSQSVEIGGANVETLMEFIEHTGDVVEEIT